MADPVKRGCAAVQSSTMRNGPSDTGLSSVLDSSDGQQHSPRPKLKLSMPGSGMSKPNDDLSSSSGENFFRGFRYQFPGFSKRDSTTADCSDSDTVCRNAGKQGDSQRRCDDDESVLGDNHFETVPETPSPLILLNKKRLYHVPARLKNPAYVSKKLRLESANGTRPASLIVEGETPAAIDKQTAAISATGEPGQKPIDTKSLLLRSNSEDCSNHVLDETLATFHKIVADTSKIMEKLCTERKALPPPKNACDGMNDTQKCPLGMVIEKSSSADGLEVIKGKTTPVLSQDFGENRKPMNATCGGAAGKHHSDGLAEPKLKSSIINGENPLRNGLESECFRSGESESTPEKLTKPACVINSPPCHWSTPSRSLKVAVVNPLLKLNSDHHNANADNASGSSHNRATDWRQERTNRNRNGSPESPVKYRVATSRPFLEGCFRITCSSEEDANDTLPSPILSSSRPLRNARTKARIPRISSSSDSDVGTLDSLRKAMDRSGGDDLTARKASKQEKDSQNRSSKKHHHPLRHAGHHCSSSSDEEANRSGRRSSRMSASWRPGLGLRETASAYMLEDPRSSHSAKARRRIKMPREWNVVDTTSDEDSDLEVLTHVKPSKMPHSRSPKDGTVAKDKRKYQAFPAGNEAYMSQRPGTSRMFEDRPMCMHRASRGVGESQRHLDPAARTQNSGMGPYNDAGNSESNMGSYAARHRPDARAGQDDNSDTLQEGRNGLSRARLIKSKSHPGKAHNGQTFLSNLNSDLFDPELSSDDAEDSPVRIVRPRRSQAASRRNERILSSSDTEVDEQLVAQQQQRSSQRRRQRCLPNRGIMRFRRVVGDISSDDERVNRDRAGSPGFKFSPLLNFDADGESVPGPSGSYRSQVTNRGRPRTPLLDHQDSPGELDAVHRIEQIETDEAYARRLQAEFDAEANAAAPPQPAANAVPVERNFTPVRAGPSIPHRYSRSRNPSPRMVNVPGSFRSSRPRQANTRSPSQQSLLNASRHRSSGGRMRGSPLYDGMTQAAVLPMLDGSHINRRMLLGFQDEWMSLIASVAVPTIESDPEETSRGRSPRSLRRRPAARANASSDDTDIDGITFESLLTYSDDEDDYWQAGIRPAPNQTGRTGARRRSRGRRAHGNYWTPNQGNDYEELLELAERLGHVSRGLNRMQINRLPTHQFSKTDGNGGENKSRTTECHICMSEYENGERLRILPCFHDFHTNCIDRWLREKNTCPVCRLRVQVS